MNNLSEYECEACGLKVEHDSTKRHIPYGWCSRNIEDKNYLLCSSCGIEGPGASDIAPSLCRKFADKGVYFKDCEQWGIKASHK
ncbi:hypothetical protein L1D29_15745 [Shewanella insulae]|uniref:hypothetical protein n=1 Tax=Shewanella insulae TaxID=2681496 RepID=UPI001EFE5BF8|nr:hypothetical protein [Shewanella insulae]MCG9714260.1 hypothetical protein [Shewanella insulae]